MGSRPDLDVDDDFSELYKEYTGPPGTTAPSAGGRATVNKRPDSGPDEEEEARDPNAVPTDFTSREAKVWEAKSKATERIWKKRKEEELICKICGESGHFTQGCPTTLGANRKSQDFFERVAAREKHVKALFTEKVISKIENDHGCKIKMDEKFIIVSGKDRLILAKGVDAVHKIIKEEGDRKGPSNSRMSRSRSPERSPAGGRLRRSESQKSHPGQHNSPHFQSRFGRQDKVVEDRGREDWKKNSRTSPQAYGNNGGRSRPSHSKSPGHPNFAGNSYNSFDGHIQSMGGYRADGWHNERRGSDMQSGHQPEMQSGRRSDMQSGRRSDMQSGRQFDIPAPPQILEELEMEYKKEANDLAKIRDKEEDKENYKHRETIREMRESYMKKMAMLRGTHAKQRDEFFQLDAQRRQQQAQQHISAPAGYGGFKQHAYSDYDGSSANTRYAGSDLPMDSRARYPNNVESYPSRPHDAYGDFQHQRHKDFGKAYNRY